MSQGLTLISGVVSGLALHEGEEEFVRSAGQQAAGIGAAAGLAAAGVAGSAVGASLAAMSAGDAVQFFSCKVSDVPMQGRFSKATFKNGDEIEAVVETASGGRNAALAVRRPKDQVLWMVPHCSRGGLAHREFATRLFLVLLIGLPIFFVAAYVGLGKLGNYDPLELKGLKFMGILDLVLGFVAASYFSIRFYFQWRPIAQQAEGIFATLGYHDPSRVDLPRDHKLYCKAHGIKWPYLSDGPWIYYYINPGPA